jgi:hypothetical protein
VSKMVNSDTSPRPATHPNACLSCFSVSEACFFSFVKHTSAKSGNACMCSPRMLSNSINCPGRKPPVLGVKRPVRPYKSAIKNRLTQENAKAA